MATTSIPVAIVQPAPSVEISTPRWLTGTVVLVWLLGLAFMIASIVAIREHRSALELIANKSATSVIAAERMAAALADMDASAANALLNPQQKQQALDAYDKARDLMTDALVDAARNIAFSGEETEIKALATGSGIYGARVEAAFTLQKSAAGNAAVLAQYSSAAQLMDASLLPGAQRVDELNRKELDASYASIGKISMVERSLVWITGLTMIAVLLRLQFYLSERMRRTLNPLCLVATVAIAGLLLYTNYGLSTATHEIHAVKSDAFESVHLLWKTKAAAYEVNAKESRALLDKANAAKYLAKLDERSTAIASNPAQLARLGKRSPSAEMAGFLADELRNITFPGEREAALKVAAGWSSYMQIDATIRAWEKANQHDQAVQLRLGEEANQSNRVFTGFIKTLDNAIELNQREFDQASARGFDALTQYEWIVPVITLAAALACMFGILPRIREYSA